MLARCRVIKIKEYKIDTIKTTVYFEEQGSLLNQLSLLVRPINTNFYTQTSVFTIFAFFFEAVIIFRWVLVRTGRLVGPGRLLMKYIHRFFLFKLALSLTGCLDEPRRL